MALDSGSQHSEGFFFALLQKDLEIPAKDGPRSIGPSELCSYSFGNRIFIAQKKKKKKKKNTPWSLTQIKLWPKENCQSNGLMNLLKKNNKKE